MLYIFDKDGTLVSGLGDRPANTTQEQRLLPSVARKCAELRAQGHTLAIASNQGGVAWDFITYREAEALMNHVGDLIDAHSWLFCPHHPMAPGGFECGCRKPKPGMINSLMAQFGTTPDQTIYVGDMESDRQAAEAAGVTFIDAQDFFKKGD